MKESLEYQREVKDRTILFSTDVLKSNKEVLKDLKKTFKGSMRNQKNPPKTPKNLTDLVRILVKTDTFMYALVVPKLSGIIHVEISNDFKTNHQRLFLSSLWWLWSSSRPPQHLEEKNKIDLTVFQISS